MQYMMSSLNGSFLTRACTWFIGKEPLPVFSNRYMVGYELSDPSSKGIGLPNMLEPYSPFSVGGGYGLVIVV